jgi:hypothetical protein
MDVSTTIRSTTGTAPITFDRISPDKVQITTEDGASQEYWTADLEAVCKTESAQNHQEKK